MYNLSNATDANDFIGIMQGMNGMTHDGLSIFILFTLFLTGMMVFRDYDIKRTFAGVSFVTSFIAGMLYFADLGGWKVVILPLLLLGVSIFLILLED